MSVKIKVLIKLFQKFAMSPEARSLWSLTAVSEILFCLTAREDRSLREVPPCNGAASLITKSFDPFLCFFADDRLFRQTERPAFAGRFLICAEPVSSMMDAQIFTPIILRLPLDKSRKVCYNRKAGAKV